MALWPRSGPVGLPSLFEIPLPDGLAFVPTTTRPVVAISRDGSQLALWGVQGGVRGTYVRDLGELAVLPVRAAEEGSMPQFSPDGSSILFLDQTSATLRRVPSDGGAAITVANSANLRGASWGDNDEVVFTRGNALWRVSAEGGTPALLAEPDSQRGHVAYRWPHVLPGGKAALITLWMVGGLDGAELGVVSLADGEVTELGIPGASPRYASSGHVVFVRADGSILAAPFSLRRLRVTGAAVPVVEGVVVRAGGAADFALSETGALVYRTGGSGALVQNEFVWVTRSGAVSVVSAGETFGLRTNRISSLRLSPDETRIAFARWEDGNFDIWTKELPDGPMSRLTFTDDASEYWPTWTPDGRSITFPRHPEGSLGPDHLFTQRSDGTGAAELVYDGHSVAAAVWSPDGDRLALRTATDLGTPGRLRDLLALRPGVDSVATPLIATEQFVEAGQAISRDGRWLAYSSNETGRHEVFVRPFPNVGDGKWQVSTDGGVQPIWAHNGRELFFVNPAGGIDVAEFTTTDDTFQRRRITTLFPLPASAFRLTAPGSGSYDVSLDDERFLMAQRVGGDAPQSAVLVQNFFEELKARVPN